MSILFLFITTISFSQAKELEDVTLEMLRETQSPTDSSAVAEVLYEKAEIRFSIKNSWEYEYKVIRRIKIYTPEGYDQANVQIPYFVGNRNSDRESVSNIEGYVYYEKDGEVEREKIRNSDIFEVDLSDLWEAKKFTLPKIQDGVIIEYSYDIDSPHINNLPKWIFQNKIPTRYSEYSTHIPSEYLAYSMRTKGYYPIESLDEIKEGRIYVRSSASQISTSIRESKHIVKNLPKIRNESHVNNVTNYLPGISYELSSYKTEQYGPLESVSRSWEDVVKTLRETNTYEKEMSRTKYFKENLKTILQDKTLPEDKMRAVFDFVKDRMTWNDEQRIYTSDRLDKVYELGVGNSADINILLTAMLREAKLEANPVLSSTISHGIPLFPTISGLNYVFSHVNINGETYVLDATEKFTTPNLLPRRALNWNGIVMKPNAFEILELVPKEHSLKKYQVQASLDPDGIIHGKCRIISYNHFGLATRKSLDKKDLEEIKLRYENNFEIKEVKDIKISNLLKTSKPLLEGFTFSSDDQKFVEQIGKKFYISPMLFLKSEKNPFLEEKRTYPIDFTFPKNVDYLISMKLPEGYKVDYLPEKTIFKFGDDFINLTYLIEENNGFVSVKVRQTVNRTLFLPGEYEDLRQFYAELINKENEKIVLVKS
ncbi:DUF3857 domain-containing protein [Psychroflexus sediminis]|uniref:Transglutaminase-like superfamily protein n=1 Tax=Psychroflexus sediminis TaxID=470826 RepID=A0A1G7V3L3_9FLAO|nr:DUF3857 domain-containing protein [Psychroflexus sediminis]SDG54317.1 Transglutaminase-like superfamily protein [Psychroflexus sediminis]